MCIIWIVKLLWMIDWFFIYFNDFNASFSNIDISGLGLDLSVRSHWRTYNNAMYITHNTRYNIRLYKLRQMGAFLIEKSNINFTSLFPSFCFIRFFLFYHLLFTTPLFITSRHF